ncbi:MAG: hypothetical protein K5945_02260 [Bacteroidaceae bacterium]|nr:hypothetical protein [Bacteroidaceae bacterium]
MRSLLCPVLLFAHSKFFKNRCKGTKKRAQSKRKKLFFHFALPNFKKFGEAKGTKKRARSKGIYNSKQRPIQQQAEADTTASNGGYLRKYLK